MSVPTMGHNYLVLHIIVSEIVIYFVVEILSVMVVVFCAKGDLVVSLLILEETVLASMTASVSELGLRILIIEVIKVGMM